MIIGIRINVCVYKKILLNNPGLSFAPVLAIMLLVFAFMIIGDAARDTLDPRLRGML
jgi:peptide/nickel transport system permease protein